MYCKPNINPYKNNATIKYISSEQIYSLIWTKRCIWKIKLGLKWVKQFHNPTTPSWLSEIIKVIKITLKIQNKKPADYLSRMNINKLINKVSCIVCLTPEPFTASRLSHTLSLLRTHFPEGAQVNLASSLPHLIIAVS